MATTPNRGYQLPAASSKLKDDVLRLIAALGAIDTDVAGLLTALAGKSDYGHGHAMAEITGLVAALGNKLDVGYHDALANLTDVDVAGVANGMALLRQASKWIPVALQINNIAGLETALNGKATPADITAAINALVAAAPGTLDTLNELATALGNDPNFATTITTALAGKLAKDGSNVGDATAQAAFRTAIGAVAAALFPASPVALNYLRRNAGNTAYESRTPNQAAEDLSTVRFNGAQTAALTQAQRGQFAENAGQTWEKIGATINIGSATAVVDFTNLSSFRQLRLSGSLRGSADALAQLLLSRDNGASWLTSYTMQILRATGTTIISAASTEAGLRIVTGTVGSAVSRGSNFEVLLEDFNVSSRFPRMLAWSTYVDESGAFTIGQSGGQPATDGACDAIRILLSAGTISQGQLALEGVRG